MIKIFSYEYISEKKKYEKEMGQAKKRLRKMQQRNDIFRLQSNNFLIKTYDNTNFMNHYVPGYYLLSCDF